MGAKKLTSFLLPGLAVLPLLGAALVGCGAGPQPIDTSTMEADNNKAVRARAIFDAAGGDWSKVSTADKEELTKLYGSTASAEQVWNFMKNPGSATPGGPPPNAPGAPVAPTGQ